LNPKEDDSSVEGIVGTSSINDILAGELPKGSTTALIGAPGTGTTVFCVQIAVNVLNRGGRVIFTLYDYHPVLLHKYFNFAGFDIQKSIDSGMLVIIDGYQLLCNSMGISKAYDIEHLRPVTSDECIDVFKKEASSRYPLKDSVPHTHITDSFTALAPFIDVRVANELVIDGCERIRAAGNASLIVAHEGVLEGNLVQALTRSVDGIIRLKMKWTSRGPTRELFVEKMPFAPTGSLSMEYEITGKGIETKPGILRERSKTTHSLDQSSEVATRTRLALPKTERTPTGVSGLDFILEGGFPKGTFICLKGDVGTGTSTFCTQFTWSNLLAGEKVAYYCADQTPDMVIRRFKSFGWNVEPYLDKELVLIDVFHFLTRDLRSSEKGSKGISARRRILDSFMKTESERIGSLLGEAKVLPVIIDSFTALAPYLDLKSSYVLARMVADSARENNETFLAVVRSSVVEANLLHACLGTTDAVIELENVWVRRKLMRRIRIDKMAFTSIPSRQIEYEITTQGIRLVPQNR